MKNTLCTFVRKCCMCAFAIAAVAGTRVDAGAVIEVDNRMKNAGVTAESETRYVIVEYELRNTGDSVLHITSVRPGCACTVAEHDTLIQPGATGKLSQQIDLIDFRDGPWRRSTTILSNATNQPKLEVFVEGIIRSTVELSARDLRIADTRPVLFGPPVIIRSRTKGLAVVSVEFEAGEKLPLWGPRFPLEVQVKLEPIPPMNPDGYEYFELKLWAGFPIESTISGVCHIRFNDPRKPLLSLRATIEPAPAGLN